MLRHAENHAPKDLLAKALGLSSAQDVFPWQLDLLDRFNDGEMPAALDVPTGLGKTAVMAIWLVAQACGAPLPRRLVYVVDRRAVVDQATTEAERLREFVESCGYIRRALGLMRALPISTLRGQHVDNREWLEDPAVPAIIVGTVDMVGSRLLFEGYGVSRKMRPFHAGLLGTDALVALDEAHLVPPFEHLLRTVAADSALRPHEEQGHQCIPPFRVLALSATRRKRIGGAIGLTKKDLEHNVVRKRLSAKKWLRIKHLDENDILENALAKEAWALTDDGKKPVRVLVYADSREVAQKTKQAVEAIAKGNKVAALKIKAELFVGGRRVFEREGAKERLQSLGFLAGREVERTYPVFLVATSAGEVGVDLDADHMVCDLVAWERMVQRLGRVNRRGEPETHAANIVVIPNREPKNIADLIAKAVDKRTDRERRLVDDVTRVRSAREALMQLSACGEHGRCRDASPAGLHELKTRAATDEALQRVLDQATTPEPPRPALTRPLVEAWAMTSLVEHTGRPAIQPWLRGWVEDDPPRTVVVWRTHLPLRVVGSPLRKKEIENFFEAAPPHISEFLDTETFRVAKWLATRAKSVQRAEQDHAGESPPLLDEDMAAFILSPDGRLRASLTLAELDPPKDNNGKKKFVELLSGATVIVDVRLAGLRDGLLFAGKTGIPRTADDGQPWLDDGDDGVVRFPFRVRCTESSQIAACDSNWRERLRFASEVTEEGEAMRWIVVEKWRHDATTEDDRSAAHPQLLEEHQLWTEECARRLANALDLDEALADVLALAARVHDEGKRAERWQRAFHAPVDGVYAKTEGPIYYRLLDGYRHELGSLLRVENDKRIQKLSVKHRDLALHLIGAHHGFARPVIGTSGCEDRPPSVLEEKAAEIALRFACLMDRWGPWGLAWWEALLRAADQQASRDNDAPASTGGDK